jgi:histidine triad (HIT) family protein
MCIFCKIVDKEIPSKMVKQDDNFMAFEDINPQAPVHILIIPKSHYDSFNEIPASQMADMTEFIQELAQELGIKDSGYRLITNIGEDGGQEVAHLHFHLLAGVRLTSII